MTFAVSVLAQFVTTDCVRGRDPCMNKERYECVADVRFVIRELADSCGRVLELTGLAHATDLDRLRARMRTRHHRLLRRLRASS